VSDETIRATESERELDQMRRRIADLEARLAEARAQVASGRAVRHPRAESGRAQAILASMLDPVISIDDTGIIQAASDSVERVLGYVPGELLGRNIKILMPEPHRSEHDGYLEHYRQTGETKIIGRTREFEVVRKDGSTIVCTLSVSRADPSEGPAVLTGILRDVTAVTRTTQALAESQRRFRALFDHAFEFIGLLEPDGRVIEINRTALEATGMTPEKVVGQPFWDTHWWSQSVDMRERAQLAVGEAAAGKLVRFEAQHVSGSGNLYEIDFSLKPMKDEAGNVVLLIAEGRDISALKRAQRTETAMQQAFATIGESAAVLAHEIKNPITAVHVALRAVATELGEDHREVLEDLIARMKRIEEMMRRTLSFAKPLELREVVCDARALFDATVAHLQAQIAGAAAVVRIRVPAGGLRFRGDPALLQDVFSNLLTNAIEAGGPSLRIALIAECAPDASILLAVEDDGPGVPESLRHELFKPFVTTKRKGNGLGLAICRKITVEHGGTLELARSTGTGARFEVRLPAYRKVP